jgi:tRNA (adenine22-N1)-methyltransferase
MPKLDDRLKAVAGQIRSRVHADIGSDHGHLLKALLSAGRIHRGIAIENKRQPYENSRATLAGLNADVRLADGLGGLQPDEANSLSLCGMGGDLIVKLLEAFPGRVPPCVTLQPNQRPESVRRWGLRTGFHIADEQQVLSGRRTYLVIHFLKAEAELDPAYDGIDREAAELFGPLLVRRWNPDFVEALREEQRYLQSLERLHPESDRRHKVVTRLLQHGGQDRRLR